MMAVILSFIVFLFGLVVGSFLNSLIYRLSTGEGLFIEQREQRHKQPTKQEKGGIRRFEILRSRCPLCYHRLGWQDLIPLVSYLLLRRRCRYCKGVISLWYPAVELATALLFVFFFNLQLTFSDGLFFQQGADIIILWFWHLLYWFFLAGALIVIFVYDLKYFLIPDKVLYPVVFLTLMNRFAEFLIPRYWTMFGVNGFEFRIWNSRLIWDFGFWNLDFTKIAIPILVGIIASAFFLAIVLISRGKGMGLGDVKFAFLMGLLLGFPKLIVALFVAFLFGAVFGSTLVLIKKKTMHSEIPFGPFLVTGTLIALFLGQRMIDWYWNLFV